MKLAVAIPLLLVLVLAACGETAGPGVNSRPTSTPNAPPPNAEAAQAIVAQDLCPTNPGHIEPELLAVVEDRAWAVYVRASEAITSPDDLVDPENYLAKFVILSSDDETLVLATDPESKQYENDLLGSC